MPKPANINAVAKESGVNAATVSFILRDPGRGSAEQRMAVAAAVKKLNYKRKVGAGHGGVAMAYGPVIRSFTWLKEVKNIDISPEALADEYFDYLFEQKKNLAP